MDTYVNTDIPVVEKQVATTRVTRLPLTAASTVAVSTDVALGDTTSAAFTTTLPALSRCCVNGVGRPLTFVRINAGTNDWTIDGSGAETINGALTVALSSQWSSITIVPTLDGWFITSQV